MLNRLSHLEAKHWLLIGGFLTSTAGVIGGVAHWADITPIMVSAVIIQFVTMLGAIFAGAPPNPNLNPVVNPGRRAEDPLPPAPLGSVTDATRRNLP